MEEIKTTIAEAIKAQMEELRLFSKPLLTVQDLSAYLDISPQYIHKMTHNRELPHYKPSGKKIYFKREEIDEWVMKGRVLTQEELRSEARKLRNKTSI